MLFLTAVQKYNFITLYQNSCNLTTVTVIINTAFDGGEKFTKVQFLIKFNNLIIFLQIVKG